MSPRARRRAGALLIALGLALIVGAVLWVLEVANGPGHGPRTFAERRSYDQVKVALQGSFPRGLAVALGGLALALAGGRLRGSERAD